MGLDAFLKRYFAVVVCLFIGVAAYFQASGMGQLVASTLALDPSALPAAPAAPHLAAIVAVNADHATSAEAIINRNPFDSVTGPLNAKPPEPMEAPAAEPVNRDPYEDPVCDVAKVLLIVASDDPEWSFASVAASDGKSMLRRQGDEVAGHKVFYVGDLRPDERRASDPRRVWDRVWLSNAGARCQMAVGGKAALKATPATAKSATPAAGAPKSKVPNEIASKIHKISDNEFNIERAVVDNILENQAALMSSVRIVPEKEGDKVMGIRLFGIRSDSVLGMLGMENGDRLSSINGFELNDPQKALEAYSKLRTADHLTVAVNRRGKPQNIDFNIK